MKPDENTTIARTLAKYGYRWAGVKRQQQKKAVVVVCATATPAYNPEKPSLTVCSTTEGAAVNGLMAAVKDASR